MATAQLAAWREWPGTAWALGEFLGGLLLGILMLPVVAYALLRGR